MKKIPKFYISKSDLLILLFSYFFLGSLKYINALDALAILGMMVANVAFYFAYDYECFRRSKYLSQNKQFLSANFQPQQISLKLSWALLLLAFLVILILSFLMVESGWKIIVLAAIGFFTLYFWPSDQLTNRPHCQGLLHAFGLVLVPALTSKVIDQNMELNLIQSLLALMMVFGMIKKRGIEMKHVPALHRNTNFSFPPYRFEPGKNQKHGHFIESLKNEQDDPKRYFASKTYLYGLDLFNHGYFWEAHEAFELCWNRWRSHKNEFKFIQGLIQLSAAYLKINLNEINGAQTLLAHSINHFQELAKNQNPQTNCCGMDLKSLIEKCESLVQNLRQNESVDDLYLSIS